MNLSEIPNFIRRGPYKLGQTGLDKQKIQKANIILEGSRHQKFMNSFEYGQSFIGKSFPKRIGTLTPPNPKILRGGTMCPPPVPDIPK